MPWTFAHPAAVLPLRRWAGTPVNFAALAIGSMVPDFGYYMFRFDGSAFAHSLPGSVTICPLLGGLLLLLGCALRRPVCYLMPQPHRDALLPLASTPLQPSLTNVLRALGWIVVGAWTHILWDSFTHEGRWFAQRIPELLLPVLTVRGHVVSGCQLLQYASSVFGVIVLLRAYAQWIRAVPRTHAQRWFAAEDIWRYGCIAGTMLAAGILALLWAFNIASRADGLFDLRVFVVRWLVTTTSLFAVAFICLAMICYWRATTYRNAAL